MDRTSPLWWLFAAISVAVYLALMFPGMTSGRQRIWISCGPVLGFAGAASYSATYDTPLTGTLPVYCAVYLGIALGVAGHQKAMRAFMAWRSENPGKPDDEGPGVPWMLQIAFTVPVLLGGALWYVSAY
ncbi:MULTISPECIES: hypothetical protein [unclassified Streptomyces]|uniref:hypothetical protein n=1 Tax=unclassified Streptomyces TaxID=2593676 RepID=UPI0006AE922C|nr:MULTISPECIES: hypothetical protein [unclassified Streptomyces]KOX30508.1 hypothetical protein ADL06_12510 [Streptomyces sp. NRRL F-6491]KOX46110.1 hypothetical protein ADL08_13490 [Streptomyces sp. NRRL F-6492]